jgi:hypothetical protein
MATLLEARLAPVTARDGVDTRKQDNSAATEVALGETTRLGAGDQFRVGQTAAFYMAPPGADVVGSPMSAYWTNYIRLADAYVNGEDCFLWVPYSTQQSFNEKSIRCACPSHEEILTLYREFYNRSITEFRKHHDSQDLEDALDYLADFNKEQTKQMSAVRVLQEWYRSCIARPRCTCGEFSMFRTGGLCVDCHWTDDASFKRLRRQNAISPR